MGKIFALALSLILMNTGGYSFASTDSINQFSKKDIEVSLVDLRDPGLVVLKLPSGEVFDATHNDEDYETLSKLQADQLSTGKNRTFLLSYTIENGVMLKDVQSGAIFSLSGVIERHPIDYAQEICSEQNSTTYGIEYCKNLALQAWDAELNKAYKELGGSKNIPLKKAQIAWIKFREAQIESLRNEYGKREGTIWGLVLMDHVVNLTKEQANLLKSIKEW